MKTMKIYEHGLTRPKRKPRFRMIRTGLAIAMAFGFGLYIGSTTPCPRPKRSPRIRPSSTSSTQMKRCGKSLAL